MKLNKTTLLALLPACLLSFTAVKADKKDAPVSLTRVDLSNIGSQKGVMRRDPSDVIKVGDLFYIWYSKGPIKPGYDATVWYATSPDGLDWTEKGLSVAKGKKGEWDAYTGTSKDYSKGFKPDSKIGIAVSDSPDGPWERLESNPVLKNSENKEDFDSYLVDDACLIVRDNKYWFYYKGRQVGKGPTHTQMGLAIAEKPEGPYIRHESNPVIPGNHEVVVWPQGTGVAALIGGVGPKEIQKSIQYAEDGINFTKTHTMKDTPFAGGTYRPEAFTDSNEGTAPLWGVEIGKGPGLPFIQRFNINWPK